MFLLLYRWRDNMWDVWFRDLIVIVDFHLLARVCDAIWLGDDSCYIMEWILAMHQGSYNGPYSMHLMDSCEWCVTTSWASTENQMESASRWFVYTQWHEKIWTLHKKSYRHNLTASIRLQMFHVSRWLKMERHNQWPRPILIYLYPLSLIV